MSGPKLRSDLSNKLDVRTSPSLTTLLIAKLNEVSILELNSTVIQEVEHNPCLEIESWDKGEVDVLGDEGDSRGDSLDSPIALPSLWTPSSGSKEREEEGLEPEAPPVGFWDRVEAQLEINFRQDEKTYRIARAIIDSLDELARLGTSVEEIAKKTGATPEEVETIRQFILREFDPPGVAALNTRELLIVQMEARNLTDTLLYDILVNRWEEAKKKGLSTFINEVSPDEKTAEENLTILESLYFSPINVYEKGQVQYVYPEVIFKEREGRIVVELAYGLYPTLYINPIYQKLSESPDVDQETKKFIRSYLERAKIYIEAITSRKQNLAKVAEFIAVNHEDFLLGKTKYLRPITQLEAARKIDITVSTLSRLVRGKYAETPVGIFELKFFFSRGVTKDGISVPKALIKDRIKELIENEDKDRPLSDEAITKILLREGYEITRRTVAKYRKDMGIPSARERKNKKSGRQ